MVKKRLWVLLEGDDDKRFFYTIVKPKIENKYHVIPYLYSRVKKEKVQDFIKSIIRMKSDYMFITDINKFPCVTQRKDTLSEIYKIDDKKTITIVIKVIEGWYLSGLDDINTSNSLIKRLDLLIQSPKNNLIIIVKRKYHQEMTL